MVGGSCDCCLCGTVLSIISLLHSLTCSSLGPPFAPLNDSITKDKIGQDNII